MLSLKSLSLLKPRLAAWSGPYVHLVMLFFWGVLVLSSSRTLLLLWQHERVFATQRWGEIMLQGVRADSILMCMGLVLPVLLSFFLAHLYSKKIWFKFTYGWSVAWLLAVLFLEISTPSFLMQYDLRPNRLYIEYLRFPKEVFFMLWQGFKITLIIGFSLFILLSYHFIKLFRVREQNLTLWRPLPSVMASFLLLILVALGIRSSLQHRPANPAVFAITTDTMVNSLVINSAYSLLYALNSMQYEAHSSDIYGKQEIAQTLQYSMAWPWLKKYRFDNANYPTLHFQKAVNSAKKPLNVVIILEESLGATFVQSLGGLPVTPELEKLKEEGVWFENLYATGTRSVRGIEAVVAGFAPTPAQSTVKLSKSQNHFTNIASVLAKKGYTTQFIYGGESHFDDMRTFFVGNGFNSIVDLNDIKKSDKNGLFIGSWGASDEDLFERADEELNKLNDTGKSFFSLIFTSSNHEPFEFPDNRIVLYEQPKATVNNAVKYADWATGRFIATAKTRAYWQNTVFLIVADHDNRAYGSNLIPIEKFKIPGLILGAGIASKKLSTISSQIDLAPTLLSLAGVSSCHTMVGRDLLADSSSPGRALLQFYDLFALLEDDGVTILEPNKKAVAGHYDAKQKKLTLSAEPVSENRRQRALAQVQLPAYLYRKEKNLSTLDCQNYQTAQEP